MTAVIRLSIDGVTVDANKGESVLTVARRHGIDIPSLCYHEKLTPTGGCRLCLVKVEGRSGHIAACTLQVSENLSVTAFDDDLETDRRAMIGLLLAENHCECAVCEVSGHCELEDLANRYGVEMYVGRYQLPARESHDGDESSPVLNYDPGRCILCERCIKACDEIQGKGILSFAHRGLDAVVTAGPCGWEASACDGCGDCVQWCPTGAIREKASHPQHSECERVQTTCSYCGVGCQLDLWTHNSRIVRITGSQAAPNFGSACVKGRFGHDYIQHSQRLTRPLVRRGGALIEVSWDDALDEVARRLRDIKSLHGPNAIGGLSSATCTNEENYLFQKLMRACLGTSNVDHCARLCHASTVAGLSAAFGSGAMTNSIAELEFAQCILVTGSNTTETHPVIANLIKRAVRIHGAKLIIVDPRKIDLVQYADVWLRQRNGTDVAWINGMMSAILSEGLHDVDFIRTRTENFEAIREDLESFSVEKAADISGISADQLTAAARMYAKANRASIVYSMGITQHTHGTHNVLSLANLAMLTGSIGKASSGVNPLRGQNNVQGACDLGALPNVYPGYQHVTNPEVREKFATAWGAAPGLDIGLTVVEMMHAAANRDLKALFIMGENPMISDPNLGHVEQALQALDFLVVQDIFLTETARLADVVLPAASFAETDGTFTNTERRILRVNAVIDPPGEARQDWRILCDLSARLGTPMHYANASDIMDEIASISPIYGGIRYDRLEPDGLQWPCPTCDHPGTAFLHESMFKRGLGKFHGIGFEPPAELPDATYPFILSTGRILPHFHTGSMSRRSDALNAYVSEAFAEVHPSDLERLGVEDGEKIRIVTRRGSIVTTARATGRVAEGSVFIPFHFAEAAANHLTNDALDPKAKIPELKVAACRLESIS